MLHYLTVWASTYFMHFGVWVTFGMGATIYQRGLPVPGELRPLLKSAVIVAAVLAPFSSHAHTHYLLQLFGK